MKMKKKPTIVVTTGDPNGIGPEVTKKALKAPAIKNLANFLVIEPEDNTGFDAIKRSVEILKGKRAHGLVTAPVNKSLINKQGIAFRGHTEYLARVTNAKKIAMMFYGANLKITLITRHVALEKVPELLTKGKIEDAILLTNDALRRYFKIQRPRIGVCALNPHCGEGGLIGTEEKEIIIPAIRDLKSKLSGLFGPLSSDAIFYMAYKGKLDAVISMYHDQGLGPFKMIAFDKGVNITLGLPFVRTSPVHGTAYDIAGKDIANATSMKEAIKLAIKMCKLE